MKNNIKTKDDFNKSVQNIVVKDGMTQKAFSYKESIIDKVYVETSIDSDHDGKADLIYAEIIRPKETEEGLKVPVIYNMSPYNGDLNYPDYHSVDKEFHIGRPSPTLKSHYDKYFVPRGYGVVTANSIGTKGSDGCPTVGDKYEILATQAVIDWLNNRAQAFNEEGEEIVADWTTGNVGMIGLSYDGTLANGVATTGVEGLKTIVPIGSISNWYDYYRANGAVVAPGEYQGDDADRLARGVLTRAHPNICKIQMDEIELNQDRLTGNYNDFWDARNYLKDVDKIRASVFVVHGLNDMNVKRKQFAQWWEKLKQNGVPRKLWLHQGGHIDPTETMDGEWLSTLNKWFDYWLYNIDNGILDKQRVRIEKIDHSWEELQEWPHPDAKNQRLYLKKSTGRALLSMTTNSQKEVKESFIDDASLLASDLIKNPFTESPNRIAYVSPVLTESLRLSGTPYLSIKASIDCPAANLTAMLVDYGPDGSEIVTRGWINPRNLNSLWEKEELIPNEPTTFTIELEPHDYEYFLGHQIGLVIISSDHEYTTRPESGTTITVYPEQSYVTLPLVGNFPHENNVVLQ